MSDLNKEIEKIRTNLRKDLPLSKQIIEYLMLHDFKKIAPSEYAYIVNYGETSIGMLKALFTNSGVSLNLVTNKGSKFNNIKGGVLLFDEVSDFSEAKDIIKKTVKNINASIEKQIKETL